MRGARPVAAVDGPRVASTSPILVLLPGALRWPPQSVVRYPSERLVQVSGYNRTWQVDSAATLVAALAFLDARGGAFFWLSRGDAPHPALAVRVTATSRMFITSRQRATQASDAAAGRVARWRHNKLRV